MAKQILEFLSAGGILAAVLIAPKMAKSFRFILKDKNNLSWDQFNDSRIRQAINHLKKKKLIKTQIKNREFVVALTENGRKEILKFDFDKIKLRKDKKWDGKWRIIMFDIPEVKKDARDALRQKLNSLGMRQVQKSVFAYPYECKKEIDFISGFYDIPDYILYLEAKIDDLDDTLKRIFKVLF